MMNEKGFTLLEMLLVMLVISVLLLLIIPNVVTQRSAVQSKGCEALIKSVEAQAQAYELEHNKFPSIGELKNGNYIATETCPDGRELVVDTTTGAVSATSPTSP
ncbi:competence type IV pilus major pilin ComGC [Bacillus sp. 165]|uniref:competence type IV pilus major pilin ComGC n=1 Tax=Bacillus sp. 165 TaxID=1529117 RepID=UPI001ADCAB07|nr:competence type IV pilus major pilin ComGC [Bacillus sp. 165]MBO9129666.1 prepilin-type N-terminal cleavage/methylation domain-containing protein [Bacillus sp. 165]